MEHRVLVAYATKHGSTGEIAYKIGEVLREAGFATDVISVEKVKSLEGYTAVLLGSAVYAGNWQKEAAQFLETRKSELAARPTWLFSSGPTGEGDPVELMKGWRFPLGLLPLADAIRPRAIGYFHGELNMDALNFAERMIVKGVRAPVGDFRDWDMITRWAQDVVRVLQQTQPV